MTDRLFLKLRERYSDYGLGDKLLYDYSKSLCNYFNFGEEELDSFVESQNDALKSIQKAIDKRVGEAVSKEREKQHGAAYEKELEIKANIAISIFNKLADIKGVEQIERQTKQTLDTTDAIFFGISSVRADMDTENAEAYEDR